MTSNDKQREAFEAWCPGAAHVPSILERDADGEYVYRLTMAHWAAWQAALAQRPEPPPPFLDRAEPRPDGGCGPRSDSGSGEMVTLLRAYRQDLQEAAHYARINVMGEPLEVCRIRAEGYERKLRRVDDCLAATH